MGRGAVELDAAAALFSGDDVGLHPVAVGDIDHGDFLALEETGGLHQGTVHRYAADVVEIGAGYGDSVDLGFYYFDVHST